MKKNASLEHRLRPYIRYFAYAQIALQGILPATLAFSPAVMAAQQPTSVSATTTVAPQHSLLLPNQTLPDLGAPVKSTAPAAKEQGASGTEQSLARGAQTMASMASSNDSTGAAQQYLMGQATAQATQEIEKWLNSYGNARVTINTNTRSDSTMDGSSFDFLLPVVNNKDSLTFMQFSTHYQDDDRLVGNVGVGQRFFFPSGWMFGINGFYDQDLTGTTSRAGVGVETWADNFKFSGNGYFAISDWKNSDELDGYDEKAANGFDLQVESYLPSYPQLGGKLKYEKYFGDDVALFDTDHLQSNPSAVTVGVNYTPIPLITLAVDYKTGQDDMDDTSINLGLNYQLGVPWSEQISSDAVGVRRSLEGSRLDFVNRNNDIVMQYRKQSVIQLGLPDSLTGEVLAAVPLAAVINAKNGADRIQWDPSSTLLTAGGQVTKVDITHYTVKMPPVPGEYRLRGVAYDKQGNASNAAETQFTANQPALTSKVTVDNAQPTVGQNATYTLTVTDSSNQPVANAKVAWDNKSFGTFVSPPDTTTDASGQAKAVLTSTVAGAAHMAATVNDAEVTGIPVVNFTADLTTATISTLTLATPQAVVANGTDKLTYTATLQDKSNNPIANQDITWTSDTGTPTTGTSKTDDKGQATFAVTSTAVAAKVTVTATFAASGSSQTNTQGSFTVDTGTAAVSELTVLPTNEQPANGTAIFTYKATVKDAEGNLLPGVTVNWAKTSDIATFGSDSGGSTSVTDKNGVAQITLSDTKAENVDVTAQVGTTDKQTVTVSFVADIATAVLLVKAEPLVVVADGTTTTALTAEVKDAHLNPVKGTTVTWNVDGSSAVLGELTSDTNDDGQATTTLKDATAENVTLTASITQGSHTLTTLHVLFTPVSGVASSVTLSTPDTAYWTDYTLGTLRAGHLTATVLDADSKPVMGAQVNYKMTCANGSDCSNKPLAEGKTGPQGENIVEVASETAATTGITLQACTTPEGGSEICSSAATLPFYEPPVISKTFQMIGQSGDITTLPDERLQYGQIQLSAKGGDNTFTWSSADESAATVDSTGIVTLVDNKPTVIRVTSLGRESELVNDSLPITTGSDMLYVSGTAFTTFADATAACTNSGGAMKSSTDVFAIVNAWGGSVTNFPHYSGVTPVFVGWVTDPGNGGEGSGVRSTVELYAPSVPVKTNVKEDAENAYPACVK